MNSLVGLAHLATGQNNEQNNFDNQNKYVEEGVVAVCRMLLNKEKEMSPSRRSSAYARLVIEKLFQNKSIDLCGIMPPNGGPQVAQHPYHVVHEVIHSRSSFFETILEADDGLSNELWFAICQQADMSLQPTTQSADSVLMQTVSFYVTRLLPTEHNVPSVGRAPLVSEIGHRKHTPLDLFLPTSPSSLHCRPPFSSHLYTFLYTFLEQCPTAFIFKDLVQCWMTFCRPWRYADALMTLSNADFLRGPWMPFIRVHEKFYRILLGKILRRVAMFDLTAESVKVIRTAVEFSWKEPMVSMLRELGVNSRPHTRQLLETVVANLRPMKIAVTYTQQAQKQSLWDIIFGAPEPPSVREQCEVIECVEGILSEADANMGTHFIAEVTPPNADNASTLSNRTPQLSETPKRAPPRLLPDHVRDPVTGLMYLTELG
ncbi:hypothetical protein OSTOST_18640, partial [Ostertagia ostertagi]